jgi:cyanophycinase-like exopeptidase
MSETVFYNSKNLVGVGNVGIGTTNPVSRLAILCDDSWQAGITLGSAATGAAGFGEFMIQRGPSTPQMGFTNTSNLMVFHSVNENSATTGPVGFLWASSSSRLGMFYDTRNSRLGIGTASPAVALDVYTGTANAASVVASTA